jgi:hypothetical protein
MSLLRPCRLSDRDSRPGRLLDSPTAMPPTPTPNARTLLREIVGLWNDLVGDLRAQEPDAAGGRVLSRAVALWREGRPTLAPYDKYPVVEPLNALLTADGHLTASCRDARTLAAALDFLTLEQLSDPPFAPSGGMPLDPITDFLVSRLYEDDYDRRMYFRLYNVEIAESPFNLPGTQVRLERLEDWQISGLTGETTITSTLHIANTGNVFLVMGESGPDDDMAWGRARWDEASALLGVLKYLKYGIVEIDYSAILFSPPWLNHVRRYGIPLWGRPRTDVEPHRYTLRRDEEQTVARYLGALLHFRPRLANLQPTLRRAIATAGDYYEGHHRRAKLEDRLIDVAIALEALFSPKEKTELRFRISHRAALLLGRDAAERQEIGRFLRTIYDGRSALVHEGASPFTPRQMKGKEKPARLSSDDLRRAGDLVRQAILRLAVLYLRGEQDRENALRRIENGAYDSVTLEALRRESDLETFLASQDL